jgi:Uma2 family endonuclease
MSAEALPVARDYISVDAYLEGERHSEVRHEYFDGQVSAMAGASSEHELVAGNLFVILHSFLRGKPCQVFKDGMKLRVQPMAGDLFYYPDIMVTSDPQDNHRFYREKPTLLIEVLSEDRNKDLVEKYLAYQRIASFEEYVVVDPNPAQREVRVFREADGWRMGESYRDGEFVLRSVGLTVKVADLFAP